MGAMLEEPIGVSRHATRLRLPASDLENRLRDQDNNALT